MAITAAMVKELREMSGAGMMDCKKALTVADGDMDKAVEVLREKGLAKAVKKAGRIAAEGMVALKVTDCGTQAVAVEVNSETDFVAKNEKFQNYVAQVAEQALETGAADIDAFLAEPWKFDASKTVNEELAGQIAVIGENLKIRRFSRCRCTEPFSGSICVSDVRNEHLPPVTVSLKLHSCLFLHGFSSMCIHPAGSPGYNTAPGHHTGQSAHVINMNCPKIAEKSPCHQKICITRKNP